MKTVKACITMILATVMLGSSVAVAASDVVTLRLSHFLPASTDGHLSMIVPWCEKIAKESDGRLKCEIYPSNQLGGTPSQLLDQLRDGVADIAWAVPTYQAGRFTKSEVFELPFMVKRSETGSQALWEYIQRNSLDEFKGIKLIFTHMHGGAQLHFGKKQVKNIEDIKGMKIRVPNRLTARMMGALGAIPVQMPVAATPEAIAKSVVDGTSMPWNNTTALKLQEICKTSTETAPNQAKHTNAIFVFAMNPAKYQSLPASLRQVIDRNSGLEVSKWAGKVWDEGDAPARKVAVGRHNKINVLTDSEYARWVKTTSSVNDEWIKEVGAKGGNGKALLDDARRLLKKYRD